MLAPGAIVDPEDLRVPGEQPGAPIIVLDDLGELPHGNLVRARQGKRLLLLTVVTPEVVMQRELRDLMAHRVTQVASLAHPNLLPTYGFVRLPLVPVDGSSEDEFDTLFIVRPDPGCPTLRQWLADVWAADQGVDAINAVAIAVQVCEALAVLHDRGAHGYVTLDTVYVYPTGSTPQVLLSGTGEGVLLPFAPNFQRFVDAGLLPISSRELLEPPYQPRIETDVLGVAGLVFEMLTGGAIEAGKPMDPTGLPLKLARVLAVAAVGDPEDRPKDILMFSRRLQAAVGLGDESIEPGPLTEPAAHGDRSDPRYPTVRAQPWRPPPAPPPPWQRAEATTALETASPLGSGGWTIAPRSLLVPPPPPPPEPTTTRDAAVATARAIDANVRSGLETGEHSFVDPVRSDAAPARSSRPDFGGTGAGTFEMPEVRLPPPPLPPARTESVSIMMPAPDGSVMAPLGRGPRDYLISRRGKTFGPYDLGQLERLIPMGKLLSVDAIQIQSTNERCLAVDLPGLRPLFEAKARETEPRPAFTTPPTRSAPAVAAPGRGGLWFVAGLLFAALVAAGGFVLYGQ